MMKRKITWVVVETVFLWGVAITPLLAEESNGLCKGFRNPPDAARPAAYWCWLNGYVEVPAAIKELQQFRENGLSGLYVFDIGARDPNKEVPAGPAFMNREWVRNLAVILGRAKQLGMEIGLITSSSWNAGGPWVTPEYGAMGLFTTQITCEGPGDYRGAIAQPDLPAAAKQHPAGLPPIYRDIAVLAIPADDVYDRPTFVFRLAPPGRHIIDHVILCNTESEDASKIGPLQRFTKGFAVYLSDTDDAPDSFRLVVQGELRPTTEPQRFDFPPTSARYVKLELLSKHDPTQPRWELGEFELYSVEGQNVVSRLSGKESRTGAALIRVTSQRAASGPWSGDCLHDGVRGGAKNSWASADEPPLIIKDPTQVLDLTSHFADDGTLRWHVPPGKWRVIRFGYGNAGQQLVLPSPNSAGWAIDHFNPEATDWHFKHILEPLTAELGPLNQTALKQLYVCSYELRGATWTPRLMEEFRQRRGYDLKPFLPILTGCIVKDEATTRRFIRDYETTLSDLIIAGFYGRAAEICHKHGLKLCAEAGGPGLPLHPVPVDALKAQGAIDIPRGEFWVDEHIWVVKETACAAQIYGKPIVDMEAFTSWRHWQDGPAELKPVADRALCEGTNHFTFHTAAHRPSSVGLPGWVYTAGTHFSPSIAWWPLARPWVEYLSRCSFLLQRGEPVTDVCYYYGDRGFNFVMPKAIDPELGFGYDYTVTNTEALLERAFVKDGRIAFAPDQKGAAVLVLSPGREILPEVLLKLQRLIRDGATVVGQKPRRSPSLSGYPECDAQVQALADEIWGPEDAPQGRRTYGKGQVIWGIPLREVLAELKILPDVMLRTAGDASLDYVHRQSPQADIYFLWNRLPRWEHFIVRVRVSHGVPEIWDPVSGNMQRAVAFRGTPEGIELPLELPPQGSLFVVFRHEESPAEAEPVVSLRRDGREVLFEPAAGEEGGFRMRVLGDGKVELYAGTGRYELQTATGKVKVIDVPPVPEPLSVQGPWHVEFPPGWGAPERVEFPELISWTEHPEPGIKYFSGIATYHGRFSLPEDWKRDDLGLVLDLGKLHLVGEVWLNGKNLGILWTSPYRVDISEVARPGGNELVVRVANDWSNRLAGDAQRADLGRFTSTNMPYAISWKVSWKDAPLLPSGLLGPVRVIPVRRVSLE